MIDPTHKLIIKNSPFLEIYGVILASDIISQIHDYNDDFNWNLRITTDISKLGKSDVFCGSESECIEKSIILETNGLEFEITKI